MNNNLLIIFTRNPELGKVKTRLAKTIGNEKALNVYNFLLKHTEAQVRSTKADKAVYYTLNIEKNDLWDDTHYNKYLQSGTHLGERMLNAFKNGFDSGYKNIIIIGSDLYDLKTKQIEHAFNQLKKNDIVIGPAQDGGYYLLGMRSLFPEIFKNKSWGTNSVLNSTLADIKPQIPILLETLNDIDTFEDLKHYKELKYLYTDA